MTFHEWFYSLPLLNVDWGARELGASLEAMLCPKGWSTRPVARLEEALRRRTGAAEAIAFERGRNALKWILEYASARVNDAKRTRVIVPALLCHAVPEAIRAAGLDTVLCDVDDALRMDVESAASVFDPDRTLAIVVPHIYGLPTPVEPFIELAGRNGAFVIDDAAASLGHRLNGVPMGLNGHAGLYSFSQGKTATAGGGGVLVLPEGSPFAGKLNDRPQLLPADLSVARKRFRRFLWFDCLHRYSDPLETIVDLGRAYLKRPKRSWTPPPMENRRMAGLQAMLALVQIDRLDELFARRSENLRILREELEGLPGLRLFEVTDGTVPTRFLIETPDHGVEREAAGIKSENPLVTHLRAHGIEARYAYLPLHRYANESHGGIGLPERSDRLARRLVLLPFLPPLARGDMARIGKAVRLFFGR